MYPPAIWEASVLHPIAFVIQDFLDGNPSWRGRLMWWVEGKDIDKGTIDIRAVHVGGSSSDRYNAETNDIKPILEWLHRFLERNCPYEYPSIKEEGD